MVSLIATKVIVIVLMTLLTLLACFLPMIVRRVAEKALKRNGMKMFMSGCLCFGGGVLLATVFLHLIPETRVSFDKAVLMGFLQDMSYPLTELVTCLGFFLVYVVEEAVHSCVGRDHHHHHNHNHNHNHAASNTTTHAVVKPGVKETAIDGDEETMEKFLPDGEEEEQEKRGGERTGVEVKVVTLRAMLVVLALSVHSIMEGLAMGLVHSNKAVWMLFGALSAHKLIIAFCMGMELLIAGVSRPAFFISLSVFAIASPIGGVIGTLVDSLTTHATPMGLLVPTILHGLSAGTLLYVTFCEILERERASPNHPVTKLLGLLGGFLLMAALQVLDTMFAPQEDGLLTTAFPPYNPVPVSYDPSTHT